MLGNTAANGAVRFAKPMSSISFGSARTLMTAPMVCWTTRIVFAAFCAFCAVCCAGDGGGPGAGGDGETRSCQPLATEENDEPVLPSKPAEPSWSPSPPLLGVSGALCGGAEDGGGEESLAALGDEAEEELDVTCPLGCGSICCDMPSGVFDQGMAFILPVDQAPPDARQSRASRGPG